MNEMQGRQIARMWIVVLALCGLQPSWAQFERPLEEDTSPHSEVDLVPERAWVVPGEPFVVALRMRMDENWHSYWKNPGDSGQETYIDWDLPEGFTAGGIQWPYPHRIDVGPLTSYGYSDEVLLLTEITPPDDLEPGSTVAIEGRADWLICADICLLANEEVSLTRAVRSSPPPPSDWHDAIAETRRKLPIEATNWDVRATRSGGTYGLRVVPPERVMMDGASFFPSAKAVLDHAAPQPVTQDGRAFLVALKQSEYAQGPAERLEGVLVAQGTDGDVRAVAVDVPVEDAQTAGLTTGRSRASLTLWWALLFAFVGGIILNLMPCVFPILSIKIVGFARQSGEDAVGIRKHGFIFGAGVVVSFWILAGLLLGLRAGGSQIGWGFQLQSPIFVALMAMLFFGIGLSLLGVFDIGTSLMRWGGRIERSASQHRGAGNSTHDRRPTSDVTSSFLSGVLATVVATPCTAPFMGAALGAALALSAADAMAVFTALGVGMALPYVSLSMAPQLLARLPKPGPWMETLKQVLAFPMFATTVWLVWVFGQQVGITGVGMLLFGLLLLGIAVWIIGRWTAVRSSARVRLMTRSLAAVGLAGALALGLLGTDYQAGTAPTSADAEWSPFSFEAVEAHRAEGRPVFIDFTAAWCLTCQVNKRTTLNADAVRRAFREKEVVLMKADWTNQNPEITRALEAHGRTGVPLYVLYKGDGSEPVLLPEILTQDIVLDAIETLPGKNTVASTEASSRKTF